LGGGVGEGERNVRGLGGGGGGGLKSASYVKLVET